MSKAKPKQKGIFVGLNPEQETQMTAVVKEVLGNEAELNAASIKQLLTIAYGLAPDKLWRKAQPAISKD